jgi:hypothetical protein
MQVRWAGVHCLTGPVTIEEGQVARLGRPTEPAFGARADAVIVRPAMPGPA